MAFLYRSAVTVTRKQPYIDWANGFDDGGPELTDELAGSRRTVYLVGESDDRADLRALLDDCWEEIFEQELAMWMEEEDDWPAPRTREVFDAWFDAEITDTVFDLAPDEPLTETDGELADLSEAFHFCAWCDLEIEEGQGRFVGFKLPDRESVRGPGRADRVPPHRRRARPPGRGDAGQFPGGGRRDRSRVPCVQQPLREGHSQGCAESPEEVTESRP